MTITDPPGTPFHRLARTPAHRWWRPVLGTAALVAAVIGVYIALFAVTALIGEIARRPVDDYGMHTFGPIGDTALELLGVAGFIPCVLFVVWWVQRRPAGTVSSVQGRLRLRWLGVCLLVSVATMALILVATAALFAVTEVPGAEEEFGDRVGAGEFTVAVLMLLVLVPLQAAGEEYAFRGWFLQAVGAFVRTPWLPIGVQAILFAVLHGVGTDWGLADLILFGSVTGWLAVRTGGLEAGIALHTVNNLLGMGFAAAFGELESAENAATAPWQNFAVDAPLLVLYAAVIAWLARRRKLVTLAPAAPATPPAETADTVPQPA